MLEHKIYVRGGRRDDYCMIVVLLFQYVVSISIITTNYMNEFDSWPICFSFVLFHHSRDCLLVGFTFTIHAYQF